MTKIERRAYAAIQQFEDDEPEILPWSVALFAREVRNEVGEVYREEHETVKEGWKRAKTTGGIRIARVTIAVD